MRPKYERLKKDIIFEQSQIDTIILKINEIKDSATEVNKAALAAYLMNFYNGIENIMKRCAKEYYKKMPRGNNWHKQLLLLSCTGNKNKISLFDKKISDKLYNYLLFRHFFIHGYTFRLDWDKIKPLVNNLDDLWQEIKNCIAEFIEKV